MSKNSRKKSKNKGSSFKKWKAIKNDVDGFWLQNMTSSGQSSPKTKNKMNTTAPINFSHLGVNQILSNKAVKDSGVKLHSNLEKTMTYGTNTKRSFSNRYYTETHGGKINSNSRRMSYKAPSGLSNVSDSENSIVHKNKAIKFKKISSNRGSNKHTNVGSSNSNARKNNLIKIRKRSNQLRNKNKMQTAPTSPSGRVTNEGSTVKIQNNKEIEYKSFTKKEENK